MRCEQLEQSRASGNRALDSNPGTFDGGGGIIVWSGTIGEIINSTIPAIRPTDSAADLQSGYDRRIVNTTIARNATTEGGGIFNLSGSTVSELMNTLVANNTAAGANARDLKNGGTITTTLHNLIEDPNGHTIINRTDGNVVRVDPMLGSLADNGGPTLTHALLAGSPAIDAANTASAPATEPARRGEARRRSG